jgi:hypothetical protein
MIGFIGTSLQLQSILRAHCTKSVWRISDELLLLESESCITTDGQSASLSSNNAPFWGLRPDLYYCQTVEILLMWGVFFEERTGLSFAIAAPQTQIGTRTEFYVAIRGGRRQTHPHRHWLLSFRPPSWLQTQPSTWMIFSFYRALSRNTNGIHGIFSAGFGGTGSSLIRRKASSEHPRSPSSATKLSTRLPNDWENEKAVYRTSTLPRHPVSSAVFCAYWASPGDFCPMRRHTKYHFTTFSPAPESRALTPPPERQKSTRPSKSAKWVCYGPLYWHTSTHPFHLHSSQTPPRPPSVPCCSNASRTPGSWWGGSK